MNNVREQIQNKVVEMITQGLESGSISEDRARNIAKLVLEQLPENMTEKELLAVLPKLDDEFKEMTQVILPIVAEYETKIKAAVLKRVLDLMRAKKFKEALATVREGLEITDKLFD